ncbi:MAG: extracellular solute-binding protein [Actinomycetota bacterium]|nr:extracellular solute-binding protein [Actinomycetota bacterium]
MNKKTAVAAVAAIALAGMLAACSGGGGSTSTSGGTSPKLANCSNTIVNKNAPEVSVWAWYPNIKTVVDNFNNQHKDVQVCWTNAGQGAPEYTKFQTAIASGKGAPDVIMLEDEQLTGFELQKGLVDLVPYGANKVKANFSAGAWKDVSQGSAVYAIPVDGGPMGMIYRTDIFAKYGITTPPTTWAEYEADAVKVKAAGGPLFGDHASNTPQVDTALIAQEGGIPFTYDLKKPKDIKIDLDSKAAQTVLNYQADLVKQGLVGVQDQFTTDYVSGLIAGKYATYIGAAWGPGYLTGAGVGKGTDSGQFAAATLPAFSSGDPAVNWGGSTFAVTTQATDKTLAAEVAEGIYADTASLTDGWQTQTIFPLNQSVLKSPEFVNNKSAFFSGQQANKEVYIPAENSYQGFDYSPFTNYYYAQFTTLLTKINAGTLSGTDAASQLQAIMVKYAKGQGFTVTQ